MMKDTSRSEQNKSTYNETDHIAMDNFNSMKKNRTYDEKDLVKINALLTKNAILYDKIVNGTMKPRGKK